MKRLAVASALIACGVAPLWSAGAKATYPGLHDLLVVPALLCQFVPMPATLAGLFVSLAALLVLVCLVAWRLVHKTRRIVRDLTRDAVRPPERLLTIARRAGLRTDFSVAGCRGFVAFTHGLARPRVVLSEDLCERLDDAELEAVLRHECAHAHRRDPLRVLIARTLSTVFAFIPFARPTLQTYLCRIELTADRATVTAMADVAPLASALQRVMLQQPHRGLAAVAVSGLSATDVRIDHLLGLDTSPELVSQPPNRLHLTLFWLTALAMLCALVASVPSVVHAGLCLVC